jgi:hypothetical protein
MRAFSGFCGADGVFRDAKIPLRQATPMVPHTIRLTTPWECEVVADRNRSPADGRQRLSLPISLRFEEFTTTENLIRRFHAPPAITQTTRIFLRIVVDQGRLCCVLNGTELEECSSGDSVVVQLQSAKVQEIRPRVYEITSAIQSYNQLNLLICGPVMSSESVVPGHDVRLLWVSLEIAEAEGV